MKQRLGLTTLFLTNLLWLFYFGNCYMELDFSRHIQHGMSKREAKHELTLENIVSYYSAEILIGTPPQPVSVQIDTGSSDLWVISTTNPLCKSTYKCPKQAMFDTQRSTTFHRNESVPFGIAYGDSTYANGTFAQDTVQIGHVSKYTEQSQNLGPVPSGFILRGANFAVAETSNSTEAVWGIGMESTESMAHNIDASGHVSPTYPNLPVQMKQQGIIATVAFSLWLNDLQSSTGSLLFGAVDHAKYTNQLQTVPMVSSYNGIEFPIDFSVMLHGVSAYNDQNVSASLVNCSLPFLLDSGTTYSQMPVEFLDPIMETIGAVRNEMGGFYFLGDEQRALLSTGGLIFNLSGVEIYVSFDELLVPLDSVRNPERRYQTSSFHVNEDLYTDESIYDVQDELNLELDFQSKTDAGTTGLNKARRKKVKNTYLVGIYSVNSSADSVYILGDTFLRSAYVVYDLENKEISLANTIYNASNSQIEEIDANGVPKAFRAPGFSETKIDSKIATFVAKDLFLSTDGLPGKTKTTINDVSVSTTVIELPSHAALGVSSTALDTQSAQANHAKHNSAIRSVPFPHTTLWGTIMILIFLR